MVILGLNVQRQIGLLVSALSNYRCSNDFAQTAFWNWYNQIKHVFLNLDKSILVSTSAQIYNLPYFGSITYNKLVGSNFDFLEITDFDLDVDNFMEWLHNIPNGMTISGWNSLPNSRIAIPPEWHTGNKCSNGFNIIWKEDEHCCTLYNYAYNGRVVFTTKKNGEIVPMAFTWVSDFKQDPQGIWSAIGKYYDYEYILKQDGECIRNGITSLMPKRNRNVSQAEYNFYKRYGLGDSIKKLDNIITEVLNNFLRRELIA